MLTHLKYVKRNLVDIHVVIAVFFIGILFWGCSVEHQSSQKSINPLEGSFVDDEANRIEHPVLAVIDGESVSATQLIPLVNEWVTSRKGKIPDTQIRTYRATVARQIVRAMLVERYAKEHNLETPGEADLLYDFMPLLPKGINLEDHLKETGQTKAYLLQRLRTEWWLNQAIADPEPAIDQNSIKRWYEDNQILFDHPARVQLELLQWHFRNNLEPAARRELKKQIQFSIINDTLPSPLQLRKAGFLSSMISRSHRWFNYTELPKPIRNWSQHAQPNDISSLFEFQDNFTIVLMHGRQGPNKISFTEVETKIAKQLNTLELQRRRQDLIDKLRKQYALSEPLLEAVHTQKRREKERADKEFSKHGLGFSMPSRRMP